MLITLSMDVVIVDSFKDNPYTVARVYYPDEGCRIEVVRGLDKALISESICHEIAHVIDWYLSEGKQSKDVCVREAFADNIGSFLQKELYSFNGVSVMPDISAIKKKMLAYEDLFGCKFDADAINSATTVAELVAIIENHADHVEACASDAVKSLREFQTLLLGAY